MPDRRKHLSADDVLNLARVRADEARARVRAERFPVADPHWAGFVLRVEAGAIPGVRHDLLSADHDDDWRVVWEAYRAGVESRSTT